MRLNATDKKLLEKLVEKIEKDFAANYSIEELATFVNMSASRLKKAFSSHYGQPIYQYTLQKKMAFASEKIKEDILTLTQISRLCGYRHSTNFSAAFKKVYGYTPRNIRPQN